MDDGDIADDEIIIRRIPEKVNSTKARHFKLNLEEKETGFSCNRSSLATPQQVIDAFHNKADIAKGKIWAAQAKVGDIRGLGLKVIVTEGDGTVPGHCEITADSLEFLNSIDLREKLAALFMKCH